MPSAAKASPRKVVILAGHDAQQRAFSGAIEAEDADLGAEVERQPDVFEDFGVGRMHLPETLHRVDKLGHKILRLQSADCRVQIYSSDC